MSLPRGVRALTFDCYGTLVDWERGLARTLDRWLEGRGIAASGEDLLPIFARLETEAESIRPAPSYRQVLARVLDGLASHLRIAVEEEERYLLADSLPDWPPFDDSVEFLRRAGESHRLVVISNVDDDLFAASQERLEARFDAVVTAQSVGAYKPEPAPFHAAIRALDGMGIAPEEVLHVAQSLYHDHVPAQRLGLRTCWVDRRRHREGWGATPAPGEEVRPDLVVASLEELAAEL